LIGFGSVLRLKRLRLNPALRTDDVFITHRYPDAGAIRTPSRVPTGVKGWITGQVIDASGGLFLGPRA
jgi:hypothetical protein